MKVPRSHPRYKSLKTREALSRLSDGGVVARTGLIAHGRGEAFDYMLGERTHPFALEAAKAAAAHLLLAKTPVLSVNGNVAALAGREMIALSKAVPAKLEVNLFHRSPARIARVVAHMEGLGAKGVLGKGATELIPGLAQPRARCTTEGIFSADVVFVPLEDGDRAEALVRMGKTVIAVDLNPLSRTAKAATVTIVDELTRAVPNVTRAVLGMKAWPEARIRRLAEGFDNERNLKDAGKAMARHVLGG
ncbi:MAG: 4-phosphopantoate--beta-alanine ligase [Methanobacteriota archaeon]